MKRIKRRASAALLLALLVVFGAGALIVRIFHHGPTWASYYANTSVYTLRGVLNCGTLTDRSGVVLAHAHEGSYGYADDDAVRIASVHAVGDYRGHIANAALSAFAGRLTGYSAFQGTTHPGNTVALSLDSRLQAAAYAALAGRSGAVMVMNYETGELLCLVSSPAYDPYGEPDENIEGLFLNRGISVSYTPGSVFKLVTLAAAVENIPDLYDRRFVCDGSTSVEGVTINCAGVHGAQTIEEALSHSCNCAFAEISLELGGETLLRYAEKFGFTHPLPLDTVETAAGNFDVAPAGSSYLAWSGIGQYTDMVCPFAMLRYTAAIAGGGTVRLPTLLLEGSRGSLRLLNPDTAQALGEMMSYTVANAYRESLDLAPLDLCAKTGTAEVGDGSSHAWFTGYLRSGPPLAVTVVLEKGGWGLTDAAPVAVEVLKKAVEIYA